MSGVSIQLGAVERAKADRHAAEFDGIAVANVGDTILKCLKTGCGDNGPEIFRETLGRVKGCPSHHRQTGQERDAPGS